MTRVRYVDRSMPVSLNELPLKSPVLMEGSVTLLSFDLAIEMGGPYRDYIAEISRTQRFVWGLDASRWVTSSLQVSSLAIEAEQVAIRGCSNEWIVKGPLASSPTSSLASAVRDLIESWGGKLLSLDSQSQVSYLTLTDWAKSIFPHTTIEFGEIKLRQLLKSYEQELPTAAELPWSGLRFFPGFVRKAGEKLMAQSLAFEWARSQTLYSPQDERGESTSLNSDEWMVNPTLHIVRQDRVRQSEGSSHFTGGAMIGFVRKDSSVVERPLNWQDAAVLDTLGECGRMLKSELLDALDVEVRAEAHGHGLKMETSFPELLDRLAEEGFLLRPILPGQDPFL